jgi:hypothetical protein
MFLKAATKGQGVGQFGSDSDFSSVFRAKSASLSG